MAVCNAWPMHEKCICGVRCVKYTTNEPNMFLMRKHEKPQILVLIGDQTSEKVPKRHFIKHLACKLWTTMWNNAWTSWNPPLIHDLFATRGQHPMQIIKRNQSHTKIWQKFKFSLPLWWKSQPRVQNSPKHNLRIQNNGKSLKLF